MPAFDPSPEAAVSSSGPTDATSRAPVLAFYGDCYVAGTDEGGLGPAGWPALVSQRIGAEMTPLHAVAGAGYVAAAPSTGDTYVTLVQEMPEPAADVTVVFGTRNNFGADPDAIYAAAMQVVSSIRAAAPDTLLLVIGPVWTDAAVPPQLPGVRDAVQRAAADADATFVDPIAERWFFDNTELIGADVVHPTDEGHAYLADRIEPAVRQLLVEIPGPDSASLGPPGPPTEQSALRVSRPLNGRYRSDVARTPDRPSFFRSLPMPSRREGLIILVVLFVTAVVVGSAAWYAGNRTTPAFDPPQGAGATLSRTTAPATPTTVRAPVLAFYGDWFVSGTEQGGLGPAGWPAIVSRRVGADGPPPHAAPDAGYVTASATTGDTFLSLVEKAPEPIADVTIVFGGRNDYATAPAEITAAAIRTFEAIRARSPGTRLLVIGPAWPEAVVPPELPPIRDAVQESAAAVGATFVDPLDERWLVDGPDLISGDDISPTDAGHAYLADRIEPVVRQALAG